METISVAAEVFSSELKEGEREVKIKGREKYDDKKCKLEVENNMKVWIWRIEIGRDQSKRKYDSKGKTLLLNTEVPEVLVYLRRVE